MKRATIQIEGISTNRPGRTFAGVSSFIIEVDSTSPYGLVFGPKGSANLPIYVNSSREFDAGVDTVFDGTEYDITFTTASATNKAYIISFFAREDPPKPGAQLPPAGSDAKAVATLLNAIHKYIESIIRR